ncbi:MAG TPA: DUF2779 domain-containing protein, partial [Bacteroidia bacterium]
MKSLFLYKNFFHLKDPVPKDRQAIFNRGNDVGILAQQIFPGGIDASPASVKKYAESVAKTKELIEKGTEVIYEAAFVFNEVLVALDILVKKDGKWYAYEVKSSLKISPAYVMDASLQYYVIKNCLPELEDIFLVTVNNEYELEDKLDVQKLFKQTSVKKDAVANLPFIADRIGAAKKMIANGDMPHVTIGEHCFKPYKCDYFGTCWKNVPERSVFQLSALGLPQQVEWYKKGIKTIASIEETEDLSKHVRTQIHSVKLNEEHLEKDKIKEFLQQIEYPVGFFDIELFAPAVPVFKDTKAYQQIPFLFSLHTLSENGELKETHFYADPGEDPREKFLLACINKLKDVKSILVFDSNLEHGVLNSLAKKFPEHDKEIQEIKKRIIDLSIPFANYWYFHPDTLGSSSLKNLYSKLYNDDAFDRMHINSGTMATYSYNALFEETDLFKIEETRQQLIEYCRMD